MATDVILVNQLRTDANVGNIRSNIGNSDIIISSVGAYSNYNTLWHSNSANSWDSIFPAAPTSGTVLCVGCMRVGTDSLLRCGMCCLWTVPAGVTVAKFELWGAGAGTLPGCCCSIQPFGMTGAYATLCIPVTAGNQYTVCAGCAFCSYACNATAGSQSGASFVQGATLCNFCATGGVSCFPYTTINKNLFPYSITLYCNMLYAITNRCYFTGDHCGNGSDTTANGICICSYGESCLSPNSNTYAVIPSMIDMYYNCTFNGHAVLASGEIRKAIGVPSRSSEFCITTGSLCGYVKHPPIPGFANTSQCRVSWTSTQTTFGGALCSPINANNYLTAPGSGGNMVYTVGGCNSNCGDAGRGGMVRITYC